MASSRILFGDAEKIKKLIDGEEEKKRNNDGFSSIVKRLKDIYKSIKVKLLAFEHCHEAQGHVSKADR